MFIFNSLMKLRMCSQVKFDRVSFPTGSIIICLYSILMNDIFNYCDRRSRYVEFILCKKLFTFLLLFASNVNFTPHYFLYVNFYIINNQKISKYILLFSTTIFIYFSFINLVINHFLFTRERGWMKYQSYNF